MVVNQIKGFAGVKKAAEHSTAIVEILRNNTLHSSCAERCRRTRLKTKLKWMTDEEGVLIQNNALQYLT